MVQKSRSSAWMDVISRIVGRIQKQFSDCTVEVQTYNPYLQEVMMPYEERVQCVYLTRHTSRFFGLFRKTDSRELCRFQAERIEEAKHLNCGVFDQGVLSIVRGEVMIFSREFNIPVDVFESFSF